MQDEAGQILEAESISAGLDYPGIGPEHAHLGEIGRARYESADDGRSSRHFNAWPARRGSSRPSSRPTRWPGSSPTPARMPSPSGSTVLVNLSGRGDKDVGQVRDVLRS